MIPQFLCANIVAYFPHSNRRHQLQEQHVENNLARYGYGGLPRWLVDRIPLVIYIPSPPIELGSSARKWLRLLPWKLRRDKRVNGLRQDKGSKWEDNWELGQYPFVRLEENHATCVICFGDFQEPKRLTTVGRQMNPERNSTEQERVPLLQVHGTDEEPEPLRLLGCGHVFHVRRPRGSGQKI